MSKLFLLFLVMCTSLWAQAVAPPVAPATLDLTPRCQRGNSQVFRLTRESITLDDQDKPTGIKKNSIDYTQLCLANNPDSGLIYEIAIDSFSIGTPQSIDETNYGSRSIVDSLMGMTFRLQYRSKIPVTGKYYDPKIPPTTGFRYIEAWEFINDFLPAKILGELYYAASHRLTKVGDTTTIVWPRPIRFTINKVINELFLNQKPFFLTLTGVTSYRGTQCATVSVKGGISPYLMDMYSTDSTSFKAKGTSQITGEFQVSLLNGNIMHAKLGERLETTITLPNKKTQTRKAVNTTELIPRVR